MRVSIVTINLNKRDGLERTLASVRAQTFRDFEQIVVDGGSSDGSLDAIRANADWIGRWVSEPDTGIYNAMNKGVAMASGDYLLFLNSGDCLAAPDVLERVFAGGGGDPGIRYGHTYVRNREGALVEVAAAAELTVYAIYRHAFCHQSTFYRRDLFSAIGLYDETYRIAADYDFTLRCLNAGVVCERMDTVVSIFEGNGFSMSSRERLVAETSRVWSRYVGVSIEKDFARIARLEADVRRLQRAEDWIEEAKRKPLWYNLALVCKWRWDRLVGKLPPRPDAATKRAANGAPR